MTWRRQSPKAFIGIALALVLRAIFIAGNEPFNQGGVNYKEACASARQKGILINTGFCGNRGEGANSNWEDGAQLAGASMNHRCRLLTADPDFARIYGPWLDFREKIINWFRTSEGSYEFSVHKQHPA